jgi:hyperosmotically inducible protein
MRRALALVVILGLAGVALYHWAPSLPSVLTRHRWFVEGRTTLQELRRDLEDTRISAGVKTALALNRSLKPFSLEVESKSATVSLRGEVASEELKMAAARVTAAVPGVDKVENHIVVKPALLTSGVDGRSLGEALADRTAEVQARLAFSLNRELKGSELEAQAFRGQLTLGGVVDSPAQRRVALDVARQIPDVGDVVDAMRLRGEEPLPPAQDHPRAAIAEHALAANPHLRAFGLKVRPAGARLAVEGAVHTALERDLAGLVAEKAAGGPVENSVEVRY